jgi:hypothetical protein
MREIEHRSLKFIPMTDKKIEKYTMMCIHTLRNWMSRSEYPELFVVIGRKAFLDANPWDKKVL